MRSDIDFNKVRKYIEKNKLTQKQFLKKLGVSWPTSGRGTELEPSASNVKLCNLVCDVMKMFLIDESVAAKLRDTATLEEIRDKYNKFVEELKNEDLNQEDSSIKGEGRDNQGGFDPYARNVGKLDFDSKISSNEYTYKQTVYNRLSAYISYIKIQISDLKGTPIKPELYEPLSMVVLLLNDLKQCDLSYVGKSYSLSEYVSDVDKRTFSDILNDLNTNMKLLSTDLNKLNNLYNNVVVAYNNYKTTLRPDKSEKYQDVLEYNDLADLNKTEREFLQDANLHRFYGRGAISTEFGSLSNELDAMISEIDSLKNKMAIDSFNIKSIKNPKNTVKDADYNDFLGKAVADLIKHVSLRQGIANKSETNQKVIEYNDNLADATKKLYLVAEAVDLHLKDFTEQYKEADLSGLKSELSELKSFNDFITKSHLTHIKSIFTVNLDIDFNRDNGGLRDLTIKRIVKEMYNILDTTSILRNLVSYFTSIGKTVNGCKMSDSTIIKYINTWVAHISFCVKLYTDHSKEVGAYGLTLLDSNKINTDIIPNEQANTRLYGGANTIDLFITKYNEIVNLFKDYRTKFDKQCYFGKKNTESINAANIAKLNAFSTYIINNEDYLKTALRSSVPNWKRDALHRDILEKMSCSREMKVMLFGGPLRENMRAHTRHFNLLENMKSLLVQEFCYNLYNLHPNCRKLIIPIFEGTKDFYIEYTVLSADYLDTTIISNEAYHEGVVKFENNPDSMYKNLYLGTFENIHNSNDFIDHAKINLDIIISKPLKVNDVEEHYDFSSHLNRENLVINPSLLNDPNSGMLFNTILDNLYKCEPIHHTVSAANPNKLSVMNRIKSINVSVEVANSNRYLLRSYPDATVVDMTSITNMWSDFSIINHILSEYIIHRFNVHRDSGISQGALTHSNVLTTRFNAAPNAGVANHPMINALLADINAFIINGLKEFINRLIDKYGNKNSINKNTYENVINRAIDFMTNTVGAATIYVPTNGTLQAVVAMPMTVTDISNLGGAYPAVSITTYILDIFTMVSHGRAARANAVNQLAQAVTSNNGSPCLFMPFNPALNDDDLNILNNLYKANNVRVRNEINDSKIKNLSSSMITFNEGAASVVDNKVTLMSGEVVSSTVQFLPGGANLQEYIDSIVNSINDSKYKYTVGGFNSRINLDAAMDMGLIRDFKCVQKLDQNMGNASNLKNITETKLRLLARTNGNIKTVFGGFTGLNVDLNNCITDVAALYRIKDKIDETMVNHMDVAYTIYQLCIVNKHNRIKYSERLYTGLFNSYNVVQNPNINILDPIKLNFSAKINRENVYLNDGSIEPDFNLLTRVTTLLCSSKINTELTLIDYILGNKVTKLINYIKLENDLRGIMDANKIEEYDKFIDDNSNAAITKVIIDNIKAKGFTNSNNITFYPDTMRLLECVFGNSKYEPILYNEPGRNTFGKYSCRSYFMTSSPKIYVKGASNIKQIALANSFRPMDDMKNIVEKMMYLYVTQDEFIQHNMGYLDDPMVQVSYATKYNSSLNMISILINMLRNSTYCNEISMYALGKHKFNDSIYYTEPAYDTYSANLDIDDPMYDAYLHVAKCVSSGTRMPFPLLFDVKAMPDNTQANQREKRRVMSACILPKNIESIKHNISYLYCAPLENNLKIGNLLKKEGFYAALGMKYNTAGRAAQANGETVDSTCAVVPYFNIMDYFIYSSDLTTYNSVVTARGMVAQAGRAAVQRGGDPFNPFYVDEVYIRLTDKDPVANNIILNFKSTIINVKKTISYIDKLKTLEDSKVPNLKSKYIYDGTKEDLDVSVLDNDSETDFSPLTNFDIIDIGSPEIGSRIYNYLDDMENNTKNLTGVRFNIAGPGAPVLAVNNVDNALCEAFLDAISNLAEMNNSESSTRKKSIMRYAGGAHNLRDILRDFLVAARDIYHNIDIFKLRLFTVANEDSHAVANFDNARIMLGAQAFYDALHVPARILNLVSQDIYDSNNGPVPNNQQGINIPSVDVIKNAIASYIYYKIILSQKDHFTLTSNGDALGTGVNNWQTSIVLQSTYSMLRFLSGGVPDVDVDVDVDVVHESVSLEIYTKIMDAMFKKLLYIIDFKSMSNTPSVVNRYRSKLLIGGAYSFDDAMIEKSVIVQSNIKAYHIVYNMLKLYNNLLGNVKLFKYELQVFINDPDLRELYKSIQSENDPMLFVSLVNKLVDMYKDNLYSYIIDNINTSIGIYFNAGDDDSDRDVKNLLVSESPFDVDNNSETNILLPSSKYLDSNVFLKVKQDMSDSKQLHVTALYKKLREAYNKNFNIDESDIESYKYYSLYLDKLSEPRQPLSMDNLFNSINSQFSASETDTIIHSELSKLFEKINDSHINTLSAISNVNGTFKLDNTRSIVNIKRTLYNYSKMESKAALIKDLINNIRIDKDISILTNREFDHGLKRIFENVTLINTEKIDNNKLFKLLDNGNEKNIDISTIINDKFILKLSYSIIPLLSRYLYILNSGYEKIHSSLLASLADTCTSLLSEFRLIPAIQNSGYMSLLRLVSILFLAKDTPLTKKFMTDLMADLNMFNINNISNALPAFNEALKVLRYYNSLLRDTNDEAIQLALNIEDRLISAFETDIANASKLFKPLDNFGDIYSGSLKQLNKFMKVSDLMSGLNTVTGYKAYYMYNAIAFGSSSIDKYINSMRLSNKAHMKSLCQLMFSIIKDLSINSMLSNDISSNSIDVSLISNMKSNAYYANIFVSDNAAISKQTIYTFIYVGLMPINTLILRKSVPLIYLNTFANMKFTDFTDLNSIKQMNNVPDPIMFIRGVIAGINLTHNHLVPVGGPLALPLVNTDAMYIQHTDPYYNEYYTNKTEYASMLTAINNSLATGHVDVRLGNAIDVTLSNRIYPNKTPGAIPPQNDLTALKTQLEFPNSATTKIDDYITKLHDIHAYLLATSIKKDVTNGNYTVFIMNVLLYLAMNYKHLISQISSKLDESKINDKFKSVRVGVRSISDILDHPEYIH
jgi:hypothetical protein